MPVREFLAGVVEGFYGPPWSQAERAQLLDWMAAWGLNTYLYAPKDDLKHRATWRSPYSPGEAGVLGAMVHGCRERHIRFVYALSPGLDIRYADPDESDRIIWRFDQMLGLGCSDFALLFDDVPDAMREEDRRRFGTFAAAHCHVANAVFRAVHEWDPAARFLFSPTPYCGRMDERELGGAGYLDAIGSGLEPGIDILWTGPEIVSREIPSADARAIGARLRRPPVIWDNLHANDYDGRRFFCGPYDGRPPELRTAVAGVLWNPNTEFPLNFVPLHTFGAFVACGATFDGRAAYVSAMSEWLPRLTAGGSPAVLEDLILFGDCYYLPHREGDGAEALCEAAGRLLASPPSAWGAAADAFVARATRLRDFCGRLARIDDRPLFFAVHRRAWELREELDLLIAYVRARQDAPDAGVRSDFHLPGTYRGGMVARLQRLLAARPDGTFEPGEP